MRNRVEEIKARGFDIIHGSLQPTPSVTPQPYISTDFSALKLGVQKVDDIIFDLGMYKKNNKQFGNREYVLKAITDGDLGKMRAISDYYYKTSPIYSRIIRYMAYMYRYDWYVTPYVEDKKMSKDKVIEIFTKCLNDLDNFQAKKTFGEIAVKILVQGAYYGYKIETSEGVVLQELHPNYCRVINYSGRRPVIAFNMAYFDDYYTNKQLRERVIKAYPKEFQKGYRLYKEGKLEPLMPGDTAGWWILDPKLSVVFTAHGKEYPMFISTIPLIIDLDEARDLDKKRSLQRLMKLVIQKMPLDKNGELIFDVEEAQQLHNNAVQMLASAVGVDVLTTFADVDVEKLSDSSDSDTQTDDIDRALNNIFSSAGISYHLFNTDSSAALEKSLLNDAATMYNMIQQFEVFLNELAMRFNKGNKLRFKAQILGTTIYNYQELSKLYKEQMQIGFSKMLPQIALGQSQSALLSTAYFENDILDLINVFIPPLMSSTMNENILDRAQKNAGKTGLTSDSGSGSGEVGRPTNESKGEMTSEKTIANKESM